VICSVTSAQSRGILHRQTSKIHCTPLLPVTETFSIQLKVYIAQNWKSELSNTYTIRLNISGNGIYGTPSQQQLLSYSGHF